MYFNPVYAKNNSRGSLYTSILSTENPVTLIVETGDSLPSEIEINEKSYDITIHDGTNYEIVTTVSASIDENNRKNIIVLRAQQDTTALDFSYTNTKLYIFPTSATVNRLNDAVSNLYDGTADIGSVFRFNISDTSNGTEYPGIEFFDPLSSKKFKIFSQTDSFEDNMYMGIYNDMWTIHGEDFLVNPNSSPYFAIFGDNPPYDFPWPNIYKSYIFGGLLLWHNITIADSPLDYDNSTRNPVGLKINVKSQDELFGDNYFASSGILVDNNYQPNTNFMIYSTAKNPLRGGVYNLFDEDSHFITVDTLDSSTNARIIIGSIDGPNSLNVPVDIWGNLSVSNNLLISNDLNVDGDVQILGDVDVSGTIYGSIIIPDGSVSYSKLQNVSATDKILGRFSSGEGVVEEISCTEFGRAILDDTSVEDQRSTLGLGTLSTQSGTFTDKITGPSSATNNAIVLFDSTTGKLVKDSSILIDATSNMTGVKDITYTGIFRTSGGVNKDWSATLYANGISLYPADSNGCAAASIQNLSSLYIRPYTMAFATGAHKYANGFIELPPDYNGSSLTFTITSLAIAGTTGGNVNWVVNPYCVGNASDLTGITITTQISPSSTVIGALNTLYVVTASGIPQNWSSGRQRLFLRIWRWVGVGGNFDNDAHLVSVKVSYT